MSAKAKRSAKAVRTTVDTVKTAETASSRSPVYWLIPAAILAAFLVYLPALGGPFVLDDLYLPFGRPDADILPLPVWLGQRPLLGLTFLANYRLSGSSTTPYHAVNILLHAFNGVLVFFLVRKALEIFAPGEDRRGLIAVFCAGLFVLHPVHAEAVAYVASRSDVLSTLFCYAALLVFLLRRGAVLSIASVAVILFLFGCGAMSKEQAVALPAGFFLIDLLAPGRRINWRLHVPVMIGGIIGAVLVLQRLRLADTAGFQAGLSWYEYFFTQWRALCRYLRLSLLPFGLNVDQDFPLSHSVVEHGAIIYLLILVALLIAAVRFRREFPLALVGLVLFFVLIAPTSSLAPIKDTFAERRLYFPFIGLLFATADLLRRVRLPESQLKPYLGAALLLFGCLGYVRAEVWSSEIALWRDSVSKSPEKWRPRFQLAFALYQAGQCPEAAKEFEATSRLTPPDNKPDPRLFVDWALALDCANRPDDAVKQLQQAVKIDNTAHIQATIAMVYAKQGKNQEALAALDTAQALDPNFPMTYVYRGNVLAAQNQWGDAEAAYRNALRLDPNNVAAARALQLAQRNQRR